MSSLISTFVAGLVAVVAKVCIFVAIVMSLYTKREFAEYCGVTTNYLSVDISRRKVVINDDGMIDTTNSINQVFIQKRLTGTVPKKEPKVASTPEPKKKPTTPPDIKPSAITKTKSQILGDVSDDEIENAKKSIEGMDYMELEMLYKYLQGEKLRTDIEKNNIEISKKRGEVVPSEPLIPIVKQHNHSILQAQKNADEEILLTVAHKYDIPADEIVFLRNEWVKLRNDAVVKATSMTIKNIENIISDYSEKRGVGQRL